MLFACKEWCCNYLLQIEDKGPGRRQSHTASVWEDHVIIAGGMDQGLRPLASVFMFSVHTRQHTLLQVQESLLPRYKKLSSHLDPLLPPPPKKKRPLYQALGTSPSTYFVTHFVLSTIPRYNKSLSQCKLSNALFQAIFRNILRYTRPLSQC